VKETIVYHQGRRVRFYDGQGEFCLDFFFQLMRFDLSHGNRAIIEAIRRWAERLPYVAPSFAYEAKVRAVEALLEVMPYKWPAPLGRNHFCLLFRLTF